MREMTFADDTPEKRREIADEIAGERKMLLELLKKVDGFSEVQSMVVIEAVEEIYSECDGDLEARCREIYEKRLVKSLPKLSF